MLLFPSSNRCCRWAVTDPTDPELFTDEQYEEFFGGPQEPLAPKSTRLPWGARALGLFVALAMGAGGLFGLFDLLASTPDVRTPAEIEAAAWERVGESEHGWLVADIVIAQIPEPLVGARVTSNPADGIVTVDERPWTNERLDELMDHEIGHLLDFALWERGDPERKGGLGTEAWAECAAVDAGTRRTDPRDPGGEYHCFDDEFDTYLNALNEFTEVCVRWGNGECRPLAPRSFEQ